MNKNALIKLIHCAGNMSAQQNDCSFSFANNTLVLITAAGQITGTPLLKADKNNETENFLIDSVFLEAAETYKSISSDDSFILLKDAVLKTSTCDISYRILYVFTDNIIAASIGNPES